MSNPEEKTTIVLQRTAQPFRLQLVRGQRGSYGWKIEVQAETKDELLYNIDVIDSYLRGKYLTDYPKIQPIQKPNNAGFEDSFRRMEQALENIKKVGEKPRPLAERV